MCIGQIKDAVHHQYGNYDSKRGQESGRENEEQPIPRTCNAKSAKSIRATRSEDDRCQGAEQADDDAVEEVVKKCVCFARMWCCQFAIGVQCAEKLRSPGAMFSAGVGIREAVELIAAS